MAEHDRIIGELAKGTVVNWREIGKALSQLEEKSQLNPSGRTWIDVMHERLKQMGQPVSKGHLHKIRRAYNFLLEGGDLLQIPEERFALAKVSSIEAAERLYQHDTDVGLTALASCLDPRQPATLAQIQRMSVKFFLEHPETKTPLQAAWERRRTSDVSSKAAEPDTTTEGASDELNDIQSRLASYAQAQVQAAFTKHRQIQSLKEDLAETEAALQQALQNYEYAKMTIEDLREQLLIINREYYR